MSKKELKLHAVVAPTETVVVSAYDKDGKADACTLAFYMVSSHIPPCVTIAINATQRRKTLANNLKGCDKDKFRSWVTEAFNTESVRAEVLEPTDFRDLYNALK